MIDSEQLLRDIKRGVEPYQVGIWALVLVIIAIFPLIGNAFLLTVMISLFFGIILALSWNVLGTTGYVNFDHAMFIGIGAFMAGHITWGTFGPMIGLSVGPGLIATLLISGIVGALFALVISFPLFRLTGHYFALAALGVAEALLATFQTYGPLKGSTGIPMPALTIAGLTPTQVNYYVLAVLAFLTLVVAYVIRVSKLGYGFRAIRLGEDAAEMLGVPTDRYLKLSFIISGFLASIGGAGYAYHLSFIEAGNVFNIILTIHAIIMTMIGGIGTVLGPIVGAIIFTLSVDLVLDSITTEGHILITGAIILFIVLVAPEGIVPKIRQNVDADWIPWSPETSEPTEEVKQ